MDDLIVGFYGMMMVAVTTMAVMLLFGLSAIGRLIYIHLLRRQLGRRLKKQ